MCTKVAIRIREIEEERSRNETQFSVWGINVTEGITNLIIVDDYLGLVKIGLIKIDS